MVEFSNRLPDECRAKIINLILAGLGVALLGEKVSFVNAFGIMLCILGVTLISYRS